MIGNIIKHEKRDTLGYVDGASEAYVDRMVRKAKEEMLQEIKENLRISVEQIDKKVYEAELSLNGAVISSTEFWV